MGSTLDYLQRIHIILTMLVLRLLIAQCSSHSRHLSELVPAAPLVLTYHHGALLTQSSPINVYILWYGTFSPAQKSAIVDFLSSFQSIIDAQPSVSNWWRTTAGYKDQTNKEVSSSFHVGGQTDDATYSLGKKLKKADIGSLIQRALTTGLIPPDHMAVYLVLTADDVYVDEFCMTCGFHDALSASPETQGEMLPFAWIGNSATQCPGQCAWPFAVPEFGPMSAPLVSPNKDVGIDGMIINIANLLAGTATNPFNTGYYEGSSEAPIEAVSACTGSFGKGSYPGYPGELLVDKISGASYNAHGVNNRMFLLPSMWDPSTHSCTAMP